VTTQLLDAKSDRCERYEELAAFALLFYKNNLETESARMSSAFDALLGRGSMRTISQDTKMGIMEKQQQTSSTPVASIERKQGQKTKGVCID